MVAAGYAAVGDSDRAQKWLERTVSDREFGMVSLRSNPAFDRIRSSACFQQLLATLSQRSWRGLLRLCIGVGAGGYGPALTRLLPTPHTSHCAPAQNTRGSMDTGLRRAAATSGAPGTGVPPLSVAPRYVELGCNNAYRGNDRDDYDRGRGSLHLWG